MITIEIMTKKDCGLCDVARATIEEVTSEYPTKLKMTDIESDPELFERYQERIPVVLINGEESFVYKVHPITLRKKLDKLLENH